MDDADVGRCPLGGQFHPGQVGLRPGEAGRRHHRSVLGEDAQGALQPQPVIPAPRGAGRDRLGGAVEAVPQDHHRRPLGQPGSHQVEQRRLVDPAHRARGLRDVPGQRQRPLAKAQRQHQHLMTVRQLALVQDQFHPSRLGRLRQHLPGERRHHLGGIDQRVGQQAGDPLVAHVDPLGRSRQRRRQVHQVGAALAQHRRHQERQALALGLALPRQPPPQFLADTRRDPFNPAHANRSAPERSVASHADFRRQPPRQN